MAIHLMTLFYKKSESAITKILNRFLQKEKNESEP